MMEVIPIDEDDDDNELHCHQQLQFISSENTNESTDLSSLECSYADAHLLQEKLKMLNVYISKLISVNSKVTKEKNDAISEKRICKTQVDELSKEKEKLETELKEATRTVDLLQEELNDKHLQLSALKSRLDGTSCLDINQLKASISDLKRMLTVEQEKSEHLISKVDDLQLAVDEKNSRISQLVNELQQYEIDKASLENEVQELLKDKQCLVEEKEKLEQKLEDIVLDREIDAEERFQDSKDSNIMIPQLMKLVIRDKNDEIDELTSQLKEIEERIAIILPFSQQNSSPISMVDELVNNYLSLKNKDDLRSTMKSPVPSMLSQCQSLPPSPRRSIYENLLSSNKSSSLKLVRNGDKSFNPDSEKEISELQLKCDKMYFAMSNLKEENEILRTELENLREERRPMELPSVNNNDLMDKDSDFIDEEDSIEDALLKIHKQSTEIVALSETSKISQETVIQAIIDILPDILLDQNNGNATYDVIDTKHYGNNHYDKCDINSERIQSFLDKFRAKKLGIQLLEKLWEIKKVYSDAHEKVKFHIIQNETISGQLSALEAALIKAQEKLDVYQKKYDKVKKKLKEQSNAKLTQPSNNNIHKDVVSYNHNGNSYPTVNPIDKVKVDQCSHGELYHQYRRCLSHRNSLIYQKKYLLNVLGGYQLTERATLALLANPNVTTNESSLPNPGRLRFKSMVIAVIAIHRIVHIRLKHLTYPAKNDPQPITQTSSKVTVLPSTLHVDLSPNPISSKPIAKDQSTTLKSVQTNATIREFVTRLQRLQRTLGVHYETRYNANEILFSDEKT
ncbi:A-kinase anchor protein 9 [Tetranychus urticae]|uniref:Pericentrin/AKAP-450 centrosomal targeting domain-containing protein n=1 Tax=Tetranychus urticae TaxID=32264 RepID=T1L389_TETUR|nr:A-kinase anchor protein 9 [Tetranychus urticae]